MSSHGITKTDREKLADMVENGALPYMDNGGIDPDAPNGQPVTCHRCGYRWHYTGNALRADCPVCRTRTRRTDDRDPAPRGITEPQCNAIREAAHDGLSYGAIGRLFTFVNDRTAVSRHARGKCQHGTDGVPAVTEHRDGGFDNERIDARTCQRLREDWAAGRFDTYADAGDAYDTHRTTASDHINGRCGH